MHGRSFSFIIQSIVLFAVCMCPCVCLAQGRPDLVWMAGGTADPVRSVVYSRDGKLIASCTGFDGADVVSLWRAADGALLRTFPSSQGYYSVAISPDSTLIAAACRDGNARVWRVGDGKPVYTLAGSGGPVYCVDFSPNGTVLAVGDEAKTVHLWRMANGSLLNTLTEQKGPILHVAFSPDGQFLVSLF